MNELYSHFDVDNPGTLTTQTKIKNGQSRDSDNIGQTKIKNGQSRDADNTNKDKEWTIQGR